MFKKKSKSETIEISMRTTFKNYRFMVFFTILWFSIGLVFLLIGLYTTITYGGESGIKFDTFLPQLTKNVNTISEVGLFSKVGTGLLSKTSSINAIGVYKDNSYVALYVVALLGTILLTFVWLPAWHTFKLYKKQVKNSNVSKQDAETKVNTIASYSEIKDNSRNLL